ncbi:MAG: OmpA family protein [Acidimicrobiales bacterium]
MTALDGAIGPHSATILATSPLAGRKPLSSGGRSGGSIYGSPGGSGPLLRAGLLVLAVIVVLVLVARNCTGSDGSESADFEESVTAGVASIDPDIVVTFTGDKDVTLSGEVADENTSLTAESQAVLAGAENVTNNITVAISGNFTSTDPASAAALQRAIDDIVTSAPITFETGSTEIAEESTATLDQVAGAIINTSSGVVGIIGHTDSQGDPERNLEISRDRANAVRVYLIDAGVDPLRVNSDGRGDTEPVADNETEEGRAANRRIEFLVQ